MKKLLALALVAVLAGAGGTAQAAKVWDDMSWWGNTATPEPVKDSKGRSGYWWWPQDPNPGGSDTELWGNRGIVYNMWTPPAPPEPEPPKEPDPVVTKVERQKPVFNNVLFDFDKSVIKPEGAAIIDEVVAELKKFPGDTVRLEGNCCNIGTEEYNMGLGQRRADSVKNHMVQAGIDAGRIQAISNGESKPSVPNDTPANRALNRNVMFDFTLGDN